MTLPFESPDPAKTLGEWYVDFDDNRKAAEKISGRYPRAAVKYAGADGFFLVDGMTEAEAAFVALTLNNMRSI